MTPVQRRNMNIRNIDGSSCREKLSRWADKARPLPTSSIVQSTMRSHFGVQPCVNTCMNRAKGFNRRNALSIESAREPKAQEK